MEKIKNEPDQILEDIQKLIELVQNTEKEQLEGVLNQHFKRYNGSGISSGENLKEYLTQLQSLTEILINQNLDLGKKFYEQEYRAVLNNIGIDFCYGKFKDNEDIRKLYVDICKIISDFSSKLEQCNYDNISVEGDYKIYANTFINNLITKDLPARPSKHPTEVIATIEEKLSEQHGQEIGSWYQPLDPERDKEIRAIQGDVRKIKFQKFLSSAAEVTTNDEKAVPVEQNWRTNFKVAAKRWVATINEILDR